MAEERVELPGSRRLPAAAAKRIGNANPSDLVDVTVTVRGPDMPDADEVIGPPVEAGSFGAQYGADPDDAAHVKAELEKFGLNVYDVSLASRSMHARGTVEQLDAAFGVSLGTYQSSSQGRFRGREGSVSIPASLDGIVTGVFGLDDRRMARRKAAPAPAVLAALTPADLESRYLFPAGDAAGQRVAIAEFGGAYFASDVQAFCAKYNRAVPAVTPISAGYPLLTIQQIQELPAAQKQQIIDASGEVMMDVEIVAALCPAADISVYFAPWNQKGWIDLLNAVAAMEPPPVALSISWGEAEDSPDWTDSALREINQRLQAAAMLGITICAASGDDGAGDQMQDGRAHINFPATSPFVLSVGGTMLTGPLAEEVPWWDPPGDRSVPGGGASGGGVSTVFPRPAWQAATVESLNAGSIDGRVVPDVAALAGEPFYDLIFLGQDAPNGGTSAATPLWAALLARIAATLPAAQRSRFFTPLLYADGVDGRPAGQTACTDIVSDGDNRSPGIPNGYAAGPGYDAVTGWGTPIGTALQQLGPPPEGAGGLPPKRGRIFPPAKARVSLPVMARPGRDDGGSRPTVESSLLGTIHGLSDKVEGTDSSWHFSIAAPRWALRQPGSETWASVAAGIVAVLLALGGFGLAWQASNKLTSSSAALAVQIGPWAAAGVLLIGAGVVAYAAFGSDRLHLRITQLAGGADAAKALAASASDHAPQGNGTARANAQANGTGVAAAHAAEAARWAAVAADAARKIPPDAETAVAASSAASSHFAAAAVVGASAGDGGGGTAVGGSTAQTAATTISPKVWAGTIAGAVAFSFWTIAAATFWKNTFDSATLAVLVGSTTAIVSAAAAFFKADYLRSSH